MFTRVTDPLLFRNFSNGCLPNEVYSSIIDFLADDQEEFEGEFGITTTLWQCLLVCKTWSQRATKYFSSRVTIKSPKQLLQYSKVVKPSYTSVHALSLDLHGKGAQKQSCSLIGSTLLLISRLPNLYQLDISCNWHNDHHPQMLKLLSNNSVKILNCEFTIYTGAIRSILEFITHFRSIHCLSLTIIIAVREYSHATPLKIQNQPFQKALPKTKICLKELHLDIVDSEIFKLVVNAFMGAKDFASHISKHSCSSYLTDSNYGSYSNGYHKLLLHCSSSLQVLAYDCPRLVPGELGSTSEPGKSTDWNPI